MSVYTQVERNELEDFLCNYAIGQLIDYQGIANGIENTNYFVTTTQGEYVLTLFEELSQKELPYFLDLMAFLAEHQVPSAHPVADRQNRYLRTLNGKPAALVAKLAGSDVETPTEQQCAALGQALGKLHAVGHEFSHHRDNDRGPHWWKETANMLWSVLNEEETRLLQTEIAHQSQHAHDDLPRGVIHADLFRDNALFVDNRLTGIIDFYYACNDVLLYDLAVAVNDWCSQPDGTLNNDCLRAMCAEYQRQRPVSDAERRAWPTLLRAAALRFWLSRLKDKHFPKEGEITHIKDPDVFRQILQQRTIQSPSLPE
jgi:homoserine kinase type II